MALLGLAGNAVVGTPVLAATPVVTLDHYSGPASQPVTATYSVQLPPGTTFCSPVPVNFSWDADQTWGQATLTYQNGQCVGSHQDLPPSAYDQPGSHLICGLDDYYGPQVCAPRYTIIPPPQTLGLHVSVSGGGKVHSSPPGIDCAPTCDAVFTAGTAVTLAASPAPETSFIGWGGDCGTAGSTPTCRLLMTADHAVTAAFTRPPGPAPVPHLSGPTTGLIAVAPLPFDASATTASERISMFAWNFEGTGFASCPADTPIAYHAFTHTGRFDVMLRVTDQLGRSTTVDRMVDVTGSAPDPRLISTAAGQALVCAGGPGPCLKQIDFDLAQAQAVSGCFTEVVPQLPGSQPVGPALGGLGAGSSNELPSTIGSTDTPNSSWSTAVYKGGGGGQGVRGPVPPIVARLVQDPNLRMYQLRGTLRLNGLLITPQSDGVILLNQLDNYLYAPHATVTIDGSDAANGGHPIQLARDVSMNRTLPNPRQGIVPLGSFPDIDRFLPHLFGFSMLGTAEARLINGQLQVSVHLQLPSLLGDGSGNPITADAVLVADNQGGLHLNDLAFDVPGAFIGPLSVQNLHVSYTGRAERWDAGGGILLEAVAVSTDVSFLRGDFEQGNGSLDLVNPGLPVFPPFLFLNEIHFGIDAGPPPVFSGTVTLSGGGTYSTPFGSKSALSAQGGLKLTASDPWALEVNGAVSSAGLKLASGFAKFMSSGDLTFGGHIDVDVFDLGVLTARADLRGGIYSDGSFDADVTATICILGDCSNGELVISSRGFGGCGDFDTGFGHIHIGGGYSWGDGIKIMGDSCGVGDWQVSPPPSARAPGAVQLVAATAAPLQLGPGLSQYVISAQGATGIPAITVAGPGGDSITTTPGQNEQRGRFLVLNSARDRTVYVAIARPAAGTWTVAAASAQPITLLRSAPPLPEPAVTGTLHDLGAGRMRLDYRVRHIPGQEVRFVELGAATAHALGVASTDTGSIEFEIGDGVAGTRRILAIVDQYSVPRATLEVASFHASGRVLPGLPTSLQAKRSGPELLVSWSAAPRAGRYALTARLNDGRRELRVVDGGTRFVTLAGVFPDAQGTITVAGLLPDGTAGPRATLELGPASATQTITAWQWLAAGGLILLALGLGGGWMWRRRRHPAKS